MFAITQKLLDFSVLNLFLPFSIVFFNRLKEIKANKGEKEIRSLHHFWQKCHCRLKLH